MQIEYHEISYSLFVDLLNRIGRDVTIPWALHLDHATTKEQCLQAVRAGFDSVMFDGSHGKLEDNIRILQELRAAVGAAITLEGELGAVGGAEATETALDAVMTDPKEAAEFVRLTGVDFLAVSIGNAHGFYMGEPQLDFDRLEKNRKGYGDSSRAAWRYRDSHKGTWKKRLASACAKCNFFSEIDRAFLEGLFEAPETTGMYMQKQKNARARMKGTGDQENQGMRIGGKGMKIGMLGVGFPNFRYDIGNEYYQAIRKQWQQKDGVTVAGVPTLLGLKKRQFLKK